MGPEDYIAVARQLAPIARDVGREVGKIDWAAVAKTMRPAAGVALAGPVVLGIGAGVAVGAGIALLAAPKRGAELRADLSSRARSVYGWVRERGTRALGKQEGPAEGSPPEDLERARRAEVFQA